MDLLEFRISKITMTKRLKYKMTNISADIKILLNLFNGAKYEVVITKSKILIRKFPEYLVLYNILGSAYQNIGNLKQAKEVFIKGLKLEPNNIALMNNLGNTHKNLGEISLAENLFKKIIQKKPDYINAYINFGNLKRDNNDFDAAIHLYNQALKVQDKNPVIYYSLALAYQGLGEFNHAIKNAQKALNLDPKFTQADLLISQSTKYDKDNKHLKEMREKIKKLKLSNNQKINLLFALSKANEDMDQIEESFKNLSHGNQIKRDSINYDINDEVVLFKQIKKIFNNTNKRECSDKSILKKNLIFILGMPRSGTSLVEQIITSHSNVFGGGELPQLSKIMKDNLMSNNDISSDKVNALIGDEFYVTQLREKYYEYLSRFNSDKSFITDKAPLNFRWIGLIKILFPDAKIIHCVRDPKDNCLSLYKNFFEGGLNFSYNQKELATYYNLYLDLMIFWQNLFPGTIYEAKYEKIINNPQNEIKAMVKFCELSWEDDCLNFHKNKTPIKTMSTAQARQPIYKSSLNSYEKFSPFLDILNKYI